MRSKVITDNKQWDDLIKSSQEGTIFHTSTWQEVSGQRFLKIGLFEGDCLVAGAIVQIDEEGRGALGGLAPYLGPVIANSSDVTADSERRQKITAELARLIRYEVPDAKFFVSPWFMGMRQFICEGFEAKLLYTTTVDVRNLGKTHANFSPTLKRNIKAAEREGLLVELKQDPTDLLSLVDKSFERQGRTVWFNRDKAMTCIKELATRAMAQCFITQDAEGNPVAGVGIVWDWNRAYYLLGGYDHLNAHRGGSSLALWTALRYTRQELELSEVDLEGSHILAIERFFRQFNGVWLPFYYLRQATGPMIGH